jgi:hypothetical protein
MAVIQFDIFLLIFLEIKIECNCQKGQFLLISLMKGNRTIDRPTLSIKSLQCKYDPSLILLMGFPDHSRDYDKKY